MGSTRPVGGTVQGPGACGPAPKPGMRRNPAALPLHITCLRWQGTPGSKEQRLPPKHCHGSAAGSLHRSHGGVTAWSGLTLHTYGRPAKPRAPKPHSDESTGQDDAHARQRGHLPPQCHGSVTPRNAEVTTAEQVGGPQLSGCVCWLSQSTDPMELFVFSPDSPWICCEAGRRQPVPGTGTARFQGIHKIPAADTSAVTILLAFVQ